MTDHTDLVREARHLVSLNEPDHFGPYQGYAAERFVVVMGQLADAIEQLQARLAVAEADAADWESIARQIAIENLTGLQAVAKRSRAN